MTKTELKQLIRECINESQAETMHTEADIKEMNKAIVKLLKDFKEGEMSKWLANTYGDVYKVVGSKDDDGIYFFNIQTDRQNTIFKVYGTADGKYRHPTATILSFNSGRGIPRYDYDTIISQIQKLLKDSKETDDRMDTEHGKGWGDRVRANYEKAKKDGKRFDYGDQNNYK